MLDLESKRAFQLSNKCTVVCILAQAAATKSPIESIQEIIFTNVVSGFKASQGMSVFCQLIDLILFNINPLTLAAFCQKCVFWTFWWFSGWISAKFCFNLVQKAFATQQFALLATSIPFYDIWARACTEIKILRFLRFWTRKWTLSLGCSIF